MLRNNVLEQPGAFQNFFENHPDGICVVDVDGHLLHVNASALRMFGYTREELLQITLPQLFDWSGGSGEARLELAIPHKRGFFVYVRVTCIPLVSGGQELGRFITFEDIS
ncbi:PAS domain S-box protein [Brevibacillus choshinensis]|uniref:PAS domain-containing protein n=1 Tax=Brevibacillus choshinensis TaxID=54911 RepID=A0ABX7FI49_BRECH|nr:PAS domain-containing protein [Brevibacillus choshinensis]QRG65893.1 PAS domain-containing protein [Brevibacillus choshinensis]